MASHPSGTNNVVGVHYRVGKKIGEGSFGVIFEGSQHPPLPPLFHLTSIPGTNLLNSTTVAIKFVRPQSALSHPHSLIFSRRNLARPKPRNSVTNVAHIASSPAAVRPLITLHPSSPNLVSSRNTTDLPLWSRGSAQYSRHRPPRPQLGRPFRHVWSQILHQNSLHGRKADGATLPHSTPIHSTVIP